MRILALLTAVSFFIAGCAPRQIPSQGYVAYAGSFADVKSAIINIGVTLSPGGPFSVYSPTFSSENNVTLTSTNGQVASTASWSIISDTPERTRVSLNLSSASILVGNIEYVYQEWFRQLDTRFKRL
jgi:hypothetical protein